VIPAYVKAENPYTGELPEEYLRGNYKAAQSDWFDTLRAKGHDAWMPASQNGNLVVALKEPQQIKSIFNNGKFDPKQKHMNKADGGSVGDEDDKPVDLGVARALRNFNQIDNSPPPEIEGIFNRLAAAKDAADEAYDAAQKAGAFDNVQIGDVYKYKLHSGYAPMKVVGHDVVHVSRWGGINPPKYVYKDHFPVAHVEYQDASKERGRPSIELLEDRNRYDFISGKPRIARADGGTVDDEGGEVGPDIQNPMSVFPKPQRMFPEDQRPAGGQYLAMPNKTDVTGHKAEAATIGVAPGGKPFFRASQNAVEQTGTPGRGSATVKTNLFKQKAGWKWQDAPEGHENTDTIVSVEHRGKHIYALNSHFPRGVDLARYEDAPSEPRLRPTTKGNVTLGPQAGSISVRGKVHPVYHHVIVKSDGGAVDAALSATRRFTKDGKAATLALKPKGK